MTSELEVDAAAIRAWATALSAAAARISTDAPPAPAAPPWSATGAELAVAHAAQVRLRALADDIATAAQQVSRAADDYADADDRAGTRLRGLPA